MRSSNMRTYSLLAEDCCSWVESGNSHTQRLTTSKWRRKYTTQIVYTLSRFTTKASLGVFLAARVSIGNRVSFGFRSRSTGDHGAADLVHCWALNFGTTPRRWGNCAERVYIAKMAT